MTPTFNPVGSRHSDRVLMFKPAGFFGSDGFSRGDIVALSSPTTKGKTIVKRLIAMEGDWVIDHKGKYVHIPKGHCWVEGDNEKVSIDSNHFGPVPLALIDSKIICSFWPEFRMLNNSYENEERVRKRPYS